MLEIAGESKISSETKEITITLKSFDEHDFNPLATFPFASQKAFMKMLSQHVQTCVYIL